MIQLKKTAKIALLTTDSASNNTAQVSHRAKLWGAPAIAFMLSALVAPISANATALLTLADGSFGTLAMGKNDDGSSSQLNLPFAINFYGNIFNNFYINNNGNITFKNTLGSFTPRSFPISSQPTIAPYWADVDTRCSSCGDVYVGAVNANTTIVTWSDVGYYSAQSDKTNNFQLALRNQLNGNFDIEFRYDRLEWTTGGASGGTDGLGGIPAQAGFDAGDNVNFFVLPDSFTNNILNIASTTNVANGTPGLWSFSIVNGQTPGTTPENPLLPVIIDSSYTFDFNVQENQQVFIDPAVAIGYDYQVQSGPNIASVLFPANIGDGNYDLYLWNNLDYIFATAITGGSNYRFADGGVNRFRVLGIETTAELDPNNVRAFITGLTFTAPGTISMSQTPIVSQVPIPAAAWLFASGLLGLGALRKKAQA
ncbi:nidogen-like domain-containing protein [Methylobacter sp. S3L5C]|uniref:nidogen-like domain-containing protein n=1 Tax=Methylobacter sp. S3L5C TaxID=2839024 RepID=UPI001FABB243|nr:nidogen-like domain-containing protein [Methylobacter sp. S3L5C]UOA10387.1 VPLPA-CTERM sorting domain-containing protein [Methylobacter sp. S3L5C]